MVITKKIKFFLVVLFLKVTANFEARVRHIYIYILYIYIYNKIHKLNKTFSKSYIFKNEI